MAYRRRHGGRQSPGAAEGNVGKGFGKPFDPETDIMIRTLTIAATAAMLIAAPASAQSMKVAVAGKTTEQLHSDIAKAAKKVCSQSVVGSSFSREVYVSCFKRAVADAIKASNDPALAAAAGVKLASR